MKNIIVAALCLAMVCQLESKENVSSEKRCWILRGCSFQDLKDSYESLKKDENERLCEAVSSFYNMVEKKNVSSAKECVDIVWHTRSAKVATVAVMPFIPFINMVYKGAGSVLAMKEGQVLLSSALIAFLLHEQQEQALVELPIKEVVKQEVAAVVSDEILPISEKEEGSILPDHEEIVSAKSEDDK